MANDCKCLAKLKTADANIGAGRIGVRASGSPFASLGPLSVLTPHTSGGIRILTLSKLGLGALHVVQGHVYEGGVDLPFFVSKSAVKSALEAKGYGDVVVLDREAAPPGTATPPGADDSWDTYVAARRTGPDSDEVLPDAVSWAREAGGDAVATTPPPTVATTPPAGIPTGLLIFAGVLAALGVGGALYVAKRHL